MTTREIAEAVGKTERCVQGWAKRTGEKISSIGEKISSVGKSGRPADYDLEESCAIIETGMGRNAADLYRMAARDKAPTDRLERLEGMVFRLVEAFSALAPQASRPDPVALPAPALSPRDELRRLVAQGAPDFGGHREAWRELYGQAYYRLHRNIKECAKNRNMDTLDYAEEEGIMPELVAIAREIFGRAA